MLNTTVSENRGGGCRLGSGAAISAAESLTLEHATIVGGAGTLDPTRSLLDTPQLTTHGSSVTAHSLPIATGDTTGTIRAPHTLVTGSAYNWFTDASCGLARPAESADDGQVQSRIFVGQRRSGSTIAPAPGSVLRVRIPAESCGTADDARGTERPQSGACDVGAVEVAAPNAAP